MNLRWDCGRQGCYRNALPDWAVFNDCFPRGIRVSDVDGIVEIGGAFLMIEWKGGKGVGLPEGQRRMLRRFADADGHNTVVCLRGGIEDMQWLVFPTAGGPTPTGWCDVRLEEVHQWVHHWAVQHNQGTA